MPEHLGLLMNLHAALIGAAAIAPRNRIVARDRARLVEQRAHHRRVPAAA